MSAFLDGVVVRDLNNQPYTLSEAWAHQPVWLQFIRHFG